MDFLSVVCGWYIVLFPISIIDALIEKDCLICDFEGNESLQSVFAIYSSKLKIHYFSDLEIVEILMKNYENNTERVIYLP